MIAPCQCGVEGHTDQVCYFCKNNFFFGSDNYKINGKNIKGNNTLGENIADNGGLKAAYHAYLEVMKNKEEPPKLPGLPLNHRQLFFVSFAQVWCSSITKEANNLLIGTITLLKRFHHQLQHDFFLLLFLDKDQHSPAKYRVIGSLSNLKEFGDEFHCKQGSNMNPKKKCEVWWGGGGGVAVPFWWWWWWRRPNFIFHNNKKKFLGGLKNRWCVLLCNQRFYLFIVAFLCRLLVYVCMYLFLVYNRWWWWWWWSFCKYLKKEKIVFRWQRNGAAFIVVMVLIFIIIYRC